ncbi:MAG: glycosyltransferase family 2 protein [Flavobacteriales bacterium]|nr:glycosyltransferase family 2 protein [Flavobacteriales bacterium]
MPAYQVGAFIGEALHSIAVQTHTTWEVIVVDDHAPDDGTRAIVEAFARERTQQVRYLRHERNQGVSAARNTAIGVARGRIPCLLGSGRPVGTVAFGTGLGAFLTGSNGRCLHWTGHQFPQRRTRFIPQKETDRTVEDGALPTFLGGPQFHSTFGHGGATCSGSGRTGFRDGTDPAAH